MDDYDIYSLIGKRFSCPCCKREHYIPTELVESGKGVISVLPSQIEGIVEGRNILLLADDITYAVAGEEIEAIFKDTGWEVAKVVLEPRGTETVHAEEKYFQHILSEVKGKDVLLTIGSGSITDMGKYAADTSGIPVVCLATAPSMNGYTSGIVALMVGGLKVSLSVRPAKAVIIDTDIIHNCPLELIQAGFADSMAKCFGNADWRLSSILTGEHFCPLPLEIITASEKKYLMRGKELLNRNEEVINDLMDCLVRGGFSMVIAGKSAPASGSEHLLSHYLDIKNHKRGREPFAYHGLQVGIGIAVVAKIYEMLGELSVEEVRKRLSNRSKADYRIEVENTFADSFPVIWKEFEKKVPVLEALSTSLVENWDEIKEKIFPAVYSQEKVRRCLQEAGCPTHFSEIGVGRELARETIINARYIRDRLTALDIADELGILQEIARNEA